MSTITRTAPSLTTLHRRRHHVHLLHLLPTSPFIRHHYHSTPADPPRLTLSHPVLSALDRCTSPARFRQIHAHMLTTGIFKDVFAASRLLKAAAFSLDPPDTRLATVLFSQIDLPDAFSCNLLIKALSRTRDLLEAMRVYRKMLVRPVADERPRPNEYTFCFLLDCCSSCGASALREGRQVHAQLVKHGIDASGVFAGTSLVHMYGECGVLGDAYQAFEEMPERTDVSWGAVIHAFANNEDVAECFRMFGEMRMLGIEPSNGTLVSLLCSCSKVGGLNMGRAVHAFVEVRGLELNVTLGTSLVDMYAKCGDVGAAGRVFSAMPEKSVASWNCMINGLAVNGSGVRALDLFREMRNSGVTAPNSSTFVGVLNACNHAGLVEQGSKCFSLMTAAYGIVPGLKHYGCMVDLYGRAGEIEEAVGFVRRMPVRPDAMIWAALLVACKIHGHAMLGEVVGAQLIKLLSQDTCGYLLLADTYAAARRWDDLAEVRKMMVDMNIKKVPGCSSICK